MALPLLHYEDTSSGGGSINDEFIKDIVLVWWRFKIILVCDKRW